MHSLDHAHITLVTFSQFHVSLQNDDDVMTADSADFMYIRMYCICLTNIRGGDHSSRISFAAAACRSTQVLAALFSSIISFKNFFFRETERTAIIKRGTTIGFNNEQLKTLWQIDEDLDRPSA